MSFLDKRIKNPDAIPEALDITHRMCSSINVATTRAGINMDAVGLMGRTIKGTQLQNIHRQGHPLPLCLWCKQFGAFFYQQGFTTLPGKDFRA